MSEADGAPRRRMATEGNGRPPSDSLSVGPVEMARLRVWRSGQDEMARATVLAAVGLVAAVVLAVVGGMPVDLPMPTHLVGWVEPTCGLTRGSTAIARGDFGLAWRYNPLSFIVMLGGLALVVRAAVARWRGSWLNAELRLTRWGWLVAAVLVLAFWAYQQQHAEFIITSRA